MEKEMQTATAVKEHITPEYWGKSSSEQEKVLQTLLGELNAIWEKTVVLHCDFSNTLQYHRTGGGIYYPYLGAICLYKGSLMTFLHEFAHSLYDDGEDMAIQWSHKIFREALPDDYQKAVRENKFFHKV